MNIREQAESWPLPHCWVIGIDDLIHCQEKVDCEGNAWQKSHSLSQGSFEACAGVVTVWKSRPWFTELIFVSIWARQLCVPCCHPVLKCSACPGQSSASTSGLYKAHSQHLSHHQEGAEGVTNLYLLTYLCFLQMSTKYFPVAPLQH